MLGFIDLDWNRPVDPWKFWILAGCWLTSTIVLWFYRRHWLHEVQKNEFLRNALTDVSNLIIAKVGGAAMPRVCPFHGCGKQIDPRNFACREHWKSMSTEDCLALGNTWTRFLDGEIDVLELREGQEPFLKKYDTTIYVGLANATPDGLVLARLVIAYIKKRKEYTKIKDGYVPEKERVGAELQKLEKQLLEAAEAIIHPKQNQLNLFDNPPTDKDRDRESGKPPH